MQYKGIEHYLETYLNDNVKENTLKLYHSMIDDIAYWPASVKYHHNEEGGLARHTEEVIYCALNIYMSIEKDMMKKLITKSDIVLIGFVHDLDKIGKYVNNNDYNEQKFQPNVYRFKYDYKRIDVNDTARTLAMCNKFGIILNEKQLNAITFAHGSWSVDKGGLKPLAAIIHAADMMSTYLFA